jgi:hypothetical protein
MDVSGNFHAPVALSPDRRLDMCLRVGLDAVEYKEISCPEKCRIPGVQPLAPRYNYWAIPMLKNKYIYKVITFIGL